MPLFCNGKNAVTQLQYEKSQIAFRKGPKEQKEISIIFGKWKPVKERPLQ
jgi:hypothetical protein